MSMVVGNGRNCAYCGKKIETKSRVWVRANFKRKPEKIRHYDETHIIDHDCFCIDFCSLPCMTNFDWKKLQTAEDWLDAHHNYEPPQHQ